MFVFSAHSGIVGVVIAPMMLLGGPLVLRAAAYTAGTVAALSLTAACAPDGKFLTWGGPLSLALGGICVASIGKYKLFEICDNRKIILISFVYHSSSVCGQNYNKKLSESLSSNVKFSMVKVCVYILKYCFMESNFY